jgi:hypothetical protein
MVDFLKIESDANRVRQSIRAAWATELQLLCVLRFFERHADAPPEQLEPYFREFVPTAAISATECPPEELLPDEIEALSLLIVLLGKLPDDFAAEQDIEALRNLERQAKAFIADVTSPSGVRPAAATADEISCLFVEHYPDLGLEPRGRLMKLGIAGSTAPANTKEDIITLDNPVEKRDDRFLCQARQSVTVARGSLGQLGKLNSKSRFRFEFTLGAGGARFTGDSLGVAFAIAAAMVASKEAVFRTRLEVSSDVAFSGALGADGTVESIDTRGLQIKICRAFFSRLRYLVIPRQHLAEAWEYLKTLENVYPARKLELVGADRFQSVMEDTRFVKPLRLGAGEYSALWVKRHARNPWIEIPILLILLAVLTRILLPYLDGQPERVRIAGHGFEVLNSYSRVLWKKSFDCDTIRSNQYCWAVLDLDGDGKKEVLLGPDASRACPESGWFFAYTSRGDSLFACDCIQRFEYPRDSIKPGEPEMWYGPKLDIVRIGGALRIISSINNNYPARGHIKMWDSAGNQLGWYIHSGGSQFVGLHDLNGDGVEELVGTGFQNRLKGQAVFVLPSTGFSGVSPPYSENSNGYDLSRVKRGSQLRYIFIAPSELARIDMPGDYQSSGVLSRPDSHEWNLSIAETRGLRGSVIVYDNLDYRLSNDFRVTQVLMSDVFVKRYRHLLATDSVPPVSLSDYPDTLLHRVQYWTDSGWVTEG